MTQDFKIMTAVDLSDYSAAAARYGVWLSMKLDAQLLMINVINHRDIEMVQRTMIGYEAFSLPKYLEEQVQDRKARMKDLFAAASPGMVDCRFIVKNGIPYWELLEAIKEEKPGLMVLSTKGRSNLADVLVGSTARRIYRRSPIPLLTIPAGFDELP